MDFDNIDFIMVLMMTFRNCPTSLLYNAFIHPPPHSHRWSKLKDALIENRSKLGEAQTLQQFSRDADEMENWLQEKLQIALDESYKDPANIQNKHQKHQAFEAELAANADRLQGLLSTGQGRLEEMRVRVGVGYGEDSGESE